MNNSWRWLAQWKFMAKYGVWPLDYLEGREDPEPECRCYCMGDQADASECPLHRG